MIRSRLLMIVLMQTLLVGCSVQPPSRPSSAKISGSLKSPEGNPVKEVNVNFIPQFSGGIQTFAKTDVEGKFVADLVPGKYAFVVEATKSKDSGIKLVPSKYFSTHPDSVVEMVQGQEVTINLSK